MRELNRLTAVEAAAGIRQGRFTSEALVVACLRRIAEREPEVQAWAHLDEAYALSQARAADAAQRSGQAVGPLAGVPVGIKDVIDTADLPTENGTSIFAGRRPKTDASVVAQLKAAGAVILGKTVTTELAFFGPGKTRNPHKVEHTPGGSSSGSAAAVADFHVPLALGTQTAGSILRPASYCGCIGWKPTFGLISRTGVLAQSPPLDTIGAFARSVEDIALIGDCMAGADPGDADMGPRPTGSLLEALRAEPGGRMRFAFVKSPAWPQGEEAMQHAFAHFIAKLGPECVTEVELPAEFADTSGLQRAVQFRDIAKNYGPIADAHPGQISAKLAEVIGAGRGVTDDEYGNALARREPLYAALGPLLSRFDAILTPAAAGPAPKGLGSTGSPAFNFLWTYLGMPAMSLPLLEAGGLPLGVQLAGARGKDARLLQFAQRVIEMV
jgi:Asp-tRNA(Asn)/Glu-tRNA(Gln) amidotransferase A subunit family amidase